MTRILPAEKGQGKEVLAPAARTSPTRAAAPAETRPDLSEEHRQEIFERSAITREVAEARGCRTIRNRSEIPDEFPPWQRRLGLLFPTNSPDGDTTGHQLKPRKPIRRKKKAGPKYETPHGSRTTLDVNPLMMGEVRKGSGDLWITEGVKKTDSLTSRGLATVGVIGVWNFAVPKSKSVIPLPCWSHVPLRSRRVYVVYDANTRTNPDVQEALRRLVSLLEKMGADVLVVYLPAVNGDWTAGVDDYLAAGGTVEELREMAAPYKPVDVGRERLKGDDKLAARVDALWRAWEEFDWSGLMGTGGRRNQTRGYSCRDAVKAVLDRLPGTGKVRPGGVGFSWAQRPWSRDAAVSDRTMPKIVRHLEAEGWIKRDESKRAAAEAASYVLTIPPSILQQEGSKQGGEEEQKERASARGYGPGAEGLRGGPDVDRMSWSSPGWKAHRRTVPGTRKVRQSKIPRRERVERPGKVRGAVVDFLYLAGGSATLQEIVAFLGAPRADNVRRLISWLADSGVVEMVGNEVRLAGDWSARLAEVRRRGGEYEARRATEVRHRLQSEAFRARGPGRGLGHCSKPSEPTAAGLEAVKRSRARRDAEMLRAARPVSELERPPAPDPVIVDALRAALGRWPDHADDYPSWWASTLYVEEYLPTRPPPPAVELAFAELSGVPGRFSEAARGLPRV